jgi:Nucleotidyltransferase of unknown function (DUF6036)
MNSTPAPSVNRFVRFLNDLDTALLPFANGERLDLYHIGRSALVWHYQAQFATKDVDFVALRTPLEEKARELFGEGSPKAKELGLYLDLVPEPLPPVSNGFQRRSQEVPGDWQVIRVWALEPNDLAATKMRSFRAQDRQDLKFLCDLGLLQAEKLRDAMKEAWIWWLDDDETRTDAFANMERVIDYLQGRAPAI